MNKEELKKHCEKQITLCLALNDYKHAEEHQVVLDILEQNQKYKEVIDKVNNKLSQYKNDLKEYQEQDRINHQNISIGLVGVKIRAFEDILKEVE